jgi:threonyl-tRNA synthetase
LEYVSSENKKDKPVMIHRALLGSIERFTGILIEHYEGNFPEWLAPTQLKIVTIGKIDDYLTKVTSKLENVRYEIDDRNIRLGEKLHEAKKMKIPLTLIIGEKDVQNNTGSLNFISGESLDNEDLDKVVKKINKLTEEPRFTF